MEARRPWYHTGRARDRTYPCEGAARHLLAAVPILSGGDVTGAVCILTEDRAAVPGRDQCRAVELAAAFLAKQLEE